MRFFNSDYFTYRNGDLFCEDVRVADIVKETGTPAYIYSKKFFIDRYSEFDDAFKDVEHTIYFASKSNFNLSVIKLFAGLGSGVDVNSEGELFRALKAGVPHNKILLTGVGKSVEEIKLGIEKDLVMIKAESHEEVHIINEVAASMGKIAKVAIRVNPDVNPNTHPYISTGLAENKFGVDTETALCIFREGKNLSNIKFTGIDMHIGSQITTTEPYREAVTKLAQLYFTLKSEGIDLEHFDIGGGIGIVYNEEKTFGPKQLAEVILPTLRKLNCEIIFEPGRFLTANGGVLATQVLYTKRNHDKNFIVIDGAMTDLLRPSIYGAYHHIQPSVLHEDRPDIIADIVGPVCESGDFLAKKREIAESRRGELLAVMSAGAYGMAMASNYNARRRPPEILVDGNAFNIIRKRESFEHLIFDEESFL